MLGFIWLFVLHTRFNRAFRSVFRFVSDDFSDDFSDNFCIVCTQTAFFIKKQKALCDFQIIFETSFASFVPYHRKKEKKKLGRSKALPWQDHSRFAEPEDKRNWLGHNRVHPVPSSSPPFLSQRLTMMRLCLLALMLSCSFLCS